MLHRKHAADIRLSSVTQQQPCHVSLVDSDLGTGSARNQSPGAVTAGSRERQHPAGLVFAVSAAFVCHAADTMLLQQIHTTCNPDTVQPVRSLNECSRTLLGVTAMTLRLSQLATAFAQYLRRA